jgi:hypothetical protein
MVTAVLFDARGYEVNAALGQAIRQFVQRFDGWPDWVEAGERVEITEQQAEYYELQIKGNGCPAGHLRVGKTETAGRQATAVSRVRSGWR